MALVCKLTPKRLSLKAMASLILCFLVCSLPSHAKAILQETPEGMTLDEAIKQAVETNPGLSAAKRDVDAARFGVGAARALTAPSVAFVPGITSLSGSGEELLIQQPLELNGIRPVRTAIATAQLRASEAQATGALHRLIFDTTVAYYDLVRARELQRVAHETLKMAEEIDRLTRRQVELGSRPGIELAQTGIEFERARQQVVLTDSQEEVARAALNILLSKAPTAALGPLSPLPTTFPPNEPSGNAMNAANQESVVQRALAARPEIAEAVGVRAVFENQVRLAQAEGRPDLAPQFRAGSVVRKFSDYGFGLALSLPLIDYGARKGRIRQAEASASAQSERIRGTERRIRQEVAQAMARERAARAVIASYQGDLLDKAKRLLDASRIGFEAGQTSIVSLIEAQRTYRAVQTEYVNALTTLVLARAELQRAAGQLPSALQGQNTTSGTTK